jgi:uncharacterized protein YjeT (DUF2065 family)
MSDMVYWFIGIMLVMLGIGLSIYLQGDYQLETDEYNRRLKALRIRGIGIAFLGLALAYLIAALFIL